MESDRIWAIKSRLLEYVKSPSLKHIRDPLSLNKLAKEILVALDQASSIWRKWDGPEKMSSRTLPRVGFRSKTFERS